GQRGGGGLAWAERTGFAVSDDGARAEDTPQPRECLAQIQPRLCFGMRAPQQSHELFAALRLWGRAHQKSQQSDQLLAGQIDMSIPPDQFEVAEQHKPKLWRWDGVHTCPSCLAR